MLPTRLLISILLAMVVALPAMGGSEITLYVNPVCGNDSNSGTSPTCGGGSGPKRTIRAAIEEDNDSVVTKYISLAAGAVHDQDDLTIIVNDTQVTQFVILGNDATILGDFGGPIFEVRQQIRFERVTIEGAVSGGDGGAIWLTDGGVAALDDVTFTNNSAARGGAVFVSSGCLATLITSATLSSNSATSSGGAIYVAAGAELHMGGNDSFLITVSANSSGLHGGAIYCAGQMLLSNANFESNHADDGGGAIACFSPPVGINVTDCEFTGNTAAGVGGGAVYFEDVDGYEIDRCLFDGNDGGQGGGIIVAGGSENGSVRNSIFRNNTASSGGGYWTHNSACDVTNCTFVNNTAVFGAAALSHELSETAYTNCIMWGNMGPAISVFGTGVANVTYSDVQGGWAGTGNIDADPMFGADGLRPQLDSPCLDTANDSVPVSVVDYEGKPRRDVGSCTGNAWVPKVDMGAFELPFPITPSGVIYVDAAGTTCAGTSWAEAMPDLRFAMVLAEQFPDDVNEIWVKQGSYRPDSGTDDRARSFRIARSIPIYGGFDGTENDPSEREPTARATLTGDIGTAGVDIDNSYHVIESHHSGFSPIFDGFIIRDGFANGAHEDRNDIGGGARLEGNTGQHFVNCEFTENFASLAGGGAHVVGPPAFTNCVFESNSAGSRGGGAWMWQPDAVGTIADCTFASNVVAATGGGPDFDGGGGLYAKGNLIIEDCAFLNNVADPLGDGSTMDGGGGILIADNVKIERCRFDGNSTGARGGGIYSTVGPNIEIRNSILTNNSGAWGGAIHVEAGTGGPVLANLTVFLNSSDAGGALAVADVATPTLFNCILWSNGVSNVDLFTPANVTATHCDVMGGWPGNDGGGNIDADPQFVDAAGGDFTPGVTSPCLDAGDNAALPGNAETNPGVDFPGSVRYIDGLCGVDSWTEPPLQNVVSAGTVDIGAYEAPVYVIHDGVHDCNDNGFPDNCDAQIVLYFVHNLIADPVLSDEFRNGTYQTYQSIVAGYGRPWAPETGQDPRVVGVAPFNAEPARALLEIALEGLCAPETDEILREVSDMFMLLGNEAFSDALDPTIGLGDGIDLATVGDFFAFDGVTGINSLLDEELALLRGREINDDFSDANEAVNYPDYDGFRAAIYNRLPPNAEGLDDGNFAYRSAYGDPLSNGEAAMDYPQGHGDAYGCYLSAIKAFTTSFRNPVTSAYLVALQPDDIEQITTGAGPGTVDVPYRSVRAMAVAMGARARAASQIVDRTFRRHYVEGSANPGQDIVEYDAQTPEGDASSRAWQMSDWASRSALGSYLDWALVNHLVPERDSTLPEGEGFDLADVNRQNIDEVAQLVGAVAEMQSRVDWAAGGRNPLGLVSNVVPFGINAGQLRSFIVGDPGGQSHYEQVREPTLASLQNASVVLSWANESNQRMRNAAETQTEFEDWVAEQEIAYDNQLIEIYGLPSIDDEADNDLDGLTEADGDDETQSPDLLRYILTDDDFAELGAAGRAAPGEIQVAMSEIRVAQIRVEQAQAVLTALSGNIGHLRDDIQQRRTNNQQAINIVHSGASQMVGLEDRLEELAVAEFETDGLGLGLGILGDIIGGAADCFGGSPAQCAGKLIATGVSAAVGAINEEMGALSEQETVEAEFDIARERINIVAWQDAELLGIEGANVVMDMKRELEGLIRQTPQVMLEIGTAREQLRAAIGQLAAAVSRGERLQAERDRMRSVARDELEAYRYEDLAFRVYRNEALQKYRGFYDLAAKYVMLAGRSYAYEYNRRDTVDNLLADVHREVRLGSDPAVSVSGGLWSIVGALDSDQDAENLDAPFELNAKAIEFSLRQNILGLPLDESNAEANLAFRAWLESNIVQQLESVPEMDRFAEMSSNDDFGPAMVLRLSTQIGPGFNFFGLPVFLSSPYGSSQFNFGYHTNMMFEYEVRYVNAGLDALPNTPSGKVFTWLMPTGDSMFREVGPGIIEDQDVRAWSVVNQNLRSILTIPAIGGGGAWEDDPGYSAWEDLANAGGDFYNAVKRFARSEGQVPHFDPANPILNTDRVGRTVWNTTWLLAVPGAQWAGADPDEIRRALLIFIYGEDPDNPFQPAPPELDLGITDIKWVVQGYRRQN